MRIRALRLKEVGLFGGGVALEGLSGGFDVLVGPNEAGKSTLLTALATLLGEKHGSTKADVVGLRPDGGGAPTIEADLELDGRLLRLRKRYLAQKQAELTDLGSGDVWRGADAEERMTALLGGRDALCSFLWVGQGQSFDLPAKPDASLARGLADLVEREAADAAGTGMTDRLAAAARVKLGALITEGRGREKVGGDLHTARRHRDTLAAALDAARAREAAAADRRTRLAQLRRQRTESSGAAAARSFADRLTAARKAVEDADRARDMLRALADRVAARQLERDAASAALERLKRDTLELESLQSDLASGATRIAQLAARRDEAAASTETHRRRAAEVTAELAGARRRLAAAQTERVRLAAQAEAAELEHRLQAATRAAARAADHGRWLAACRVTDAGVEELRRLALQLASLTSRVEAESPRATITYLPGTTQRISIGGRVLAEGESLVVEAPLEIEIEGVGVIRLEPGASGGLPAAAERDQTRDALAAALRELDVADVTAAETVLAERREHERGAVEAAAGLATAAPRGLPFLRSALQSAAERAAGQPLPDLPDSAEVADHVAALEEALGQLSAQAAAFEATFQTLGNEIVRIEAAMSAASRRASGLEAALPPAPDREAGLAARSAAMEAAAATLSATVREHTSWKEIVPDGPTCEALVAQATAAAEAAAAFERQRTGLGQQIASLEGALQRDDEEGTGADVAGLEEELAAAQARLDDLLLEVDALTLLVEKLDAVGRRHREEVLRPVVERLARLMSGVLPGASIALEGPLLVARLDRDHRSDALSRLSGGTREQVATLVRLAYADLMAGRGLELPLILDDALVFSDDVRLAAMIDVLAEAARRHQVVVLSCHERALAPLVAAAAANRLQLVPWADTEVAQARPRTQKGRAQSPASDLVR